ncbi:hypothetical protein [Streptomyces umbrinus]|uniref:hypothetical protein n=1 Tax=Streptomyces umbrinus TaxID=67370 RepID=UPI0033F67454
MRSVRWLTVILVTLVVFTGCLWLLRSAAFGWMPDADADRWAVAIAFATVVAGSVGTALGWWAGRGEGDVPTTRQTASATKQGEILQVGRDRTDAPPATDPGSVPRVEQEARATGGRIDQIGRDWTRDPRHRG